MTTPSATPPPITDGLRAEARANPGAWIYAVDPGFDGSPDVPPEGIVGAWRTTASGELSEEFTPNPRYRPTPQARGWSEPLSPLERVLQLVLAGYLPDDQLVRAFASAEVFVFDRPEGGLFLAPAQDGGRLLYAFTDASKATASGHAGHVAIRGSEVAVALPDGAKIALNPGSHVSSLVEPSKIGRA